MNNEENTAHPNYNLLQGLLWGIAGIFVATFILSWLFYPDTYYFFRYYVSYLGGVETFIGNPNPISRYIFTAGIWACGLLALIMAIIYIRPKNFTKLNLLKGIFLLLVVFGAIFTGIPWDTLHDLHLVGASVFYFAFDLYVFLCQFTRYRHEKISFDTKESKRITFDKWFVILMFLIVLAYFIIYGLRFIFPSWDDTLRIGMVITQKVIVISFLLGIILLDPEDY